MDVLFSGHALLAALLAAAAAGLATPPPSGRAPARLDTPALARRAVVSEGDTTRIDTVLQRARRGEPITIGFIGGSITQGALASRPENRYANRLADWWQRRFPQSRVKLVNAGIGATCSDYGALRAERDLLVGPVDLVVVEYAVNDNINADRGATFEGLLRKILAQPQHPGVVLLFMMSREGASVQGILEPIGRHYGLPMISYADALWPEIQTGRMDAAEVFADEVHPNDRGHELAARFLELWIGGRQPRQSSPGPLALPAPLYSDIFQHTQLRVGAALAPTRAQGWTLEPDGKFWVAKQPGSILECVVEGRQVDIVGWRIRGDMGRIRVQVDDRPPVTVEGWFAATWGGMDTVTVAAKGLSAGSHTVRIELLADKAEESGGTTFRLQGVGAAGVK